MKKVTDPRAREDTLPWWRYRMVWLVIAGPAVVVVAAVITAVIAIRGADLLVDDSTAQREATRPGAHTPALSARNHAATTRP